jgi:hypothetical protein
MEIEERITKDIGKFEGSLKELGTKALSKKETDVVELAKMYAMDAEAWVKKKDWYTAFASISYAHGLLDAIKRIEE